ncbi:MAG: T9SS type A sorting domain-containing protein [Flavobacteriales bacterium]|nr:T9SS type A sorting domain-containing protein [Flavobacteriales bacterium]
MTPRSLSFLLALAILTATTAQEVPIGNWRDHLPYRSIKHIAETNTHVYAASDAGVFRVGLDDDVAQRFSTVDGLAEVGVTAMGASPDGSVLMVGYESGVLDIVKENGIVHVYDIYRSNVIGDKSINHFMFQNDLCYISTGFGIVAFNYTKIETKETYFIGPKGANLFVNQTHFYSDTLWAATREGLYRASIKSDLYDPRSWAADQTLPDSAKAYNIVTSMGAELMVNVKSNGFRSDTLYSRINGKWGINPFVLGESNNSITSYGDKVVISASTSVEVYSTDWSVIRREFAFNASTGLNPNIAIFGKNDILWIGDEFAGLGKNSGTGHNQVTNLGGPSSNRAFNVFYDQEKTIVTGGANAENWFTLKQPAEFSYMKDNLWSIFNKKTVPEFEVVSDITSVTVDPKNADHYFVSSLNEGIFQFQSDNLIKNYNQYNSILDTAKGICFVSDIKFDNNGNLWILNSLSQKPIVILTTDGTWHSFPLPGIGDGFQTGRLTISKEGYLWITSPNGGVVVYDPGDNLTSPSDDRSKQFTTAPNGGNLPDNEVYCVSEDADGHMWVGTRVGLRVFYNASNAFNSTFPDAQDIYIQQDGQTKILLENENVSWILSDGSNKKWLSTRSSGVFYLSSDGTKELAHFTKENSPLFSDYVTSLALNSKTGEVLMATDKGLIGFRGAVTDGGESFSEVYVFPNPVRPDYTGLIAITGLVDGSVVKITDVGGSLVYETTSQGGQATWNGSILNGQRAATGVYLVVASGNEGDEKIVTKILFLR